MTGVRPLTDFLNIASVMSWCFDLGTHNPQPHILLGHVITGIVPVAN